MVPRDGLHDVYDHIAQVHQHPLTGIRSFHAQHRGSGLSNFVVHAFCECAGLAVAGTTGEHHAVEEGGDGGGVEDLDVLGFYIFQGIHHKELQAGEISVQGVAPNRWMLNRVGLVSRTACGINRVGFQEPGHSLGHEGIDGQPPSNRLTHLAGGHSVCCE